MPRSAHVRENLQTAISEECSALVPGIIFLLCSLCILFPVAF